MSRLPKMHGAFAETCHFLMINSDRATSILKYWSRGEIENYTSRDVYSFSPCAAILKHSPSDVQNPACLEIETHNYPDRSNCSSPPFTAHDRFIINRRLIPTFMLEIFLDPLVALMTVADSIYSDSRFLDHSIAPVVFKDCRVFKYYTERALLKHFSILLDAVFYVPGVVPSSSAEMPDRRIKLTTMTFLRDNYLRFAKIVRDNHEGDPKTPRWMFML
ncbi:uncharacterized protein EV420DRAFT_1742579 [Desarmillaria tabescens]|uniref:Uncharacterized protein n=1 Tax=Armillaria tabescens TaxID=1929756 RepID=A0AA39NQX3_ARMTA|nr:uncharacterized protein EV420DRAFT_1742579 [Desarmillaria tabescens]KAK0470151.1 hypothetical protein EV420DRAFT_1742579 [Desarmillaria tabescens]